MYPNINRPNYFIRVIFRRQKGTQTASASRTNRCCTCMQVRNKKKPSATTMFMAQHTSENGYLTVCLFSSVGYIATIY